jgi:hypothetical protein
MADKVTIKQSGVIVKQGKQYLVVIQQKNWKAIEKLKGKKLNEEITFTASEF